MTHRPTKPPFPSSSSRAFAPPAPSATFGAFPSLAPRPAPRVWWRELLARVRASTWMPLGVRAVAVVGALLVLAWIGRTAAARPNADLLSAAMGVADAAAAPAPVALAADAAAPPAAEATPSAIAPVVIAPPASHGRASPTEPVYLNQASVDELRRLPGVGPKRAEAILVLRQRIGRFHRVEDLLRVKGIGRRTVKKWRALVRLDAPTPSDAGLP